MALPAALCASTVSQISTTAKCSGSSSASYSSQERQPGAARTSVITEVKNLRKAAPRPGFAWKVLRRVIVMNWTQCRRLTDRAKLRATRSPAQGCGTKSVPRQGHNTPLPLKRSPLESFKRLLGCAPPVLPQQGIASEVLRTPILPIVLPVNALEVHAEFLE